MKLQYPLTDVLLIIALTAMTLAVLSIYPKYRTLPDQQLNNHDFSKKYAGWEKSGPQQNFSLTQDYLQLSQSSTKHNTRLIQYITGEELAGSYQLSAHLRTENLLQGEKGWQRAGLVLLRFDETGKRIASYDVISLDGTTPWAQYRRFIDMPGPTKKIAVVARILNASGDFRIKSIDMFSAEKQKWFETIRLSIAAVWAALFLWLLYRTIKFTGLTIPLLVIGTLIILAFAGTLLPKELVVRVNSQIADLLPSGLSAFLRDSINAVLPGYLTHTHQEISKFGHWLIFLLMGFLAAAYFRKSSLLFCALAALSIAAATETLQFLTNARTPHVNDFLIDSAGLICGLILAVPIRRIQTRA